MTTSIIILNWNGLSLLKRCVASIKAHTLDYELVIVDNGSSEDGTKEYIQSITDKYVFNEINLGFAKGNNQGTKVAGGEFLCFMNNDIMAGPGWLLELHKTLEHPGCGAVGPLANPRYRVLQGQMVETCQYKGQYTEDTEVTVLVGSCILVKKEVFDKIGGWNEDFGTGNFEDDYFSELIKKEGLSLWVSAKSDVTHALPGRTFEINKIDYFGTYEKNKELYKKKLRQLYNE